MRLIKAEIVGHYDPKSNRYAVYSMDIQPNSNRLATGGGDCCIKIWNFDALLSTPANAKDALLSTLSSHTKSVNVVRWSHDGKLLASGSDDNYILIHRYTPGAISNQTFGSNTANVKNKETWTRCYSLQGHSMDVLDLDWLPGSVEYGYTLATASVDNRIIIWNLPPIISTTNNNTTTSSSSHVTSTLISPTQVLNGHTSFVKGLAYDPIGKYLISSSSDNTIIIWDIQNNYTILHTLTEPLYNAPDKTLFRRLSWSPDGQSVCITAAQKSSKPIGMVLKRGSWESVADLVGHTASSICTKFCTHVMQYNNTSSNSSGSSNNNSQKERITSCVVALGDQNGVLSIWSTHSNRPMYVLREVCNGGITDITWSRNNKQTALCCCGIDGTVIIIELQSELGIPMSNTILEKHFHGLYGRNITELHQKPIALIENTLALKYTKQLNNTNSSMNGTTHGMNGSPMSTLAHRHTNTTTNTTSSTTAATTTNYQHQPLPQQQQTTQMVGGKKRIRPVLMQCNFDSPEEVCSVPIHSGSSSSSSNNANSNAVPIALETTSSNTTNNIISASNLLDNDNTSKRSRTTTTIDEAGPPPRQFTTTTTSNNNNHSINGNINSVPSNNLSRTVNTTFHNNNNNNNITVKTTPTVERFLTIQFNNNDMMCSVPLLNTQQYIHRYVRCCSIPTTINVTDTPCIRTNTGLSSLLCGNNSTSSKVGVKTQYLLTASRLTKPAVLAQLRHSGGPMSTLTLSTTTTTTTTNTTSSSTGSTGSYAGDSKGSLWNAVVAGEVTCIAGVEGHSSSSNTTTTSSAPSTTAPQDGMCLVGCSDGTLHCFSFACGMRQAPPMVLGCAVAYVDIHIDTSSTTTPTATTTPPISTQHNTIFYIVLAVTADGELWKWKVNSVTLKFQCMVRTTLRPVLLSMKCQQQRCGIEQGECSKNGSSTTAMGINTLPKGRNTKVGTSNTTANSTNSSSSSSSSNKKETGSSIRVEQCVLSDCGDIHVHCKSTTALPEGGEWQAYCYDAEGMLWQRLADMRHILSSLFEIRDLSSMHHTSPIVSADTLQHSGLPHPIPTTSTATTTTSDNATTSLTVLQSLAVTGANFGLRDVLSITTAKQTALHTTMLNTLHHNNNSTTNTTGSNNSDVSNKLSPGIDQWTALATISHVEDRLSVALSLGSAEEVERWLSHWVNTCCQNGLTGRLQWLARRLIEQHIAITTSSSTTSSSGNNILHSNNNTTTSITTSTTTNTIERYHSCISWVQRLTNPLQLLQTLVMPIIAQNPSVHTLLAEINLTMEMLKLG